MVTAEEALSDQAIHAYLLRMIGEEGVELLDKFPKEGEFSDEDLAERTEINLNTVRHTLYTLYGKKLAQYRRIKNSETGWLTYLWTLRLDQLDGVLYEDTEGVLDKLEARERYEDENDFYFCKNCGVRYTFEEVFATDFKCSNCDESLEHFDNDLLLQALKTRVAAIRASLGKV